jgi:hypothetical protein
MEQTSLAVDGPSSVKLSLRDKVFSQQMVPFPGGLFSSSIERLTYFDVMLCCIKTRRTAEDKANVMDGNHIRSEGTLVAMCMVLCYRYLHQKARYGLCCQGAIQAVT